MDIHTCEYYFLNLRTQHMNISFLIGYSMECKNDWVFNLTCMFHLEGNLLHGVPLMLSMFYLMGSSSQMGNMLQCTCLILIPIAATYI
jgi:hypothetical protein